MEAIPRATQQKDRPLFLASPPALRTQQSVGFHSIPSTPANLTRRLAQRLSSVTPQTKIRPLAPVHSSTLLPAATTRPMEHSRFLTTQEAATTRRSVLLHSLTIRPAPTMLHWAATPAPMQQRVQITSILAQECRARLVKAMPVISKASLARPLPVASRSSLTQITSSVRLLLQSALSRRSNQWTRQAKCYSR